MLDNIKDSPKYRWYVMSTVLTGVFMSTLDGSIVNVALPTIASDFHYELSVLQWVVTVYLLTICSVLPIFGRLADMIGTKKVFAMGYLLFALGSVLCGLSPNLGFLIFARIVQAIGSAALMSNSFAIITATFPAGERGKALGLVGTFVALGSLTGPALGGLLIGWAGWRSIFYINVPIGILAMIATWLILNEEAKPKERGSFDLAGAILFAVGIISLLYAVNNGSDWGWTNPLIIGGIILGIILLVVFVIVEKKQKHPMLSLSLFRIRPFLLGSIAGLLSFVAMFANNMILPFYLQHVLLYKPTQVGLLMMAFPVALAITAPLSGRASDRTGPMILTTTGLALIAVGLFYFSTLDATSQFYQVVLGSLLMGSGAGLFQSPNNNSIMSSVPRHELGIAGAINSLVRNIGMIIGIAFSVTLFEALGGVSTPTYEQTGLFMHAYHVVMLSAMGVALIAMFISISRKNYINTKASIERGK